MTNEEKSFLDCWRLRVRIAQSAHYNYAGTLKRRHIQLGLPVVILTTIVGTSVFSSLSNEPSQLVIIIIGLISIASASLASLQTFLDFSGRSEKHRIAAVSLSALKKKIEAEIIMDNKEGSLLHEFIELILSDWTKINSDCPLPPEKVYKKAFNDLNGKNCFNETIESNKQA